MATHSSVLAWRIRGTGEPGGLSSMGLHRLGHDWGDLAAAAAAAAESLILTMYFATVHGVTGVRRDLLTKPCQSIALWRKHSFCFKREDRSTKDKILPID